MNPIITYLLKIYSAKFADYKATSKVINHLIKLKRLYLDQYLDISRQILNLNDVDNYQNDLDHLMTELEKRERILIEVLLEINERLADELGSIKKNQ